MAIPADPPLKDGFRLQLKFWGVRGSIPTPQPQYLGMGGNTACLEARARAGDIVLIDAGTGIRDLGAALDAEFAGRPLPLHCFFSHFHWDHIQGIPFFNPLYAAATDMVFHSTKAPDHLRDILTGLMAEPFFPIPFESLACARRYCQTGNDRTRCGAISVDAFPVNHPQGASGFRFEADGAVIVHISDCEHGEPVYDRLMRDYSQNADVLIYDAQYSPEEYDSRRGWGHSTWLEATRLARDARVKRLLLFHHDPSHDDAFIEDMVAQARRHFENTDAGREGMMIRI